jgi:hypothetical protein
MGLNSGAFYAFSKQAQLVALSSCHHWETAVTNFCNFFTKTITPENSSRRILYSFVPSQDLKSRLVTICDETILHVHVFCGKSVGVTNYFSSLLTNGFTAAVVTIG